ncbi:formate/nitrite transporter family protein [Sphingomonas sp. MMS24-JH45]
MAEAERDEIEELKAAERAGRPPRRAGGGGAGTRPHRSSLFWSALAAGIAINASLVAMALLDAAHPRGAGEAAAGGAGLSRRLRHRRARPDAVLHRKHGDGDAALRASPDLRHRGRRTLRLWGIVLAANFLVGTFLTTGALYHGGLVEPAVRDAIVHVSAKLMTDDALHSFLIGIPAGFLIAGIAWLLPNAREQAFFVIVTITWLVGAAGFAHSVVGSAEAWVLFWAGSAGATRSS